jgi:hypothetical protein
MNFRVILLYSILMASTKPFSCEQDSNMDINYVTKSGVLSSLNREIIKPFKIEGVMGMVYYGEATKNAVMYIDSERNLHSNTSVIARGITSFTITNGTIYAVKNRENLIKLINNEDAWHEQIELKIRHREYDRVLLQNNHLVLVFDSDNEPTMDIYDLIHKKTHHYKIDFNGAPIIYTDKFGVLINGNGKDGLFWFKDGKKVEFNPSFDIKNIGYTFMPVATSNDQSTLIGIYGREMFLSKEIYWGTFDIDKNKTNICKGLPDDIALFVIQK